MNSKSKPVTPITQNQNRRFLFPRKEGLPGPTPQGGSWEKLGLKLCLLGLPLGWGATGWANATLNLEGFLEQVKTGNQGFQSSLESKKAAELRSEEGKILFAPSFYANAQITQDSKLPPSLFVIYDSQLIQSYSVGISQQTSFGLGAKLHYDLLQMDYINPTFQLGGGGGGGGQTQLFAFNYGLATPVLELSQSLWANGFGRTTKALEQQTEAGALASKYKASFETKLTLTEAERAYWRLASAREVVKVQKEALDRTKRIYVWNEEKAQLQLRDKADVLQAQALMKSRELELLNAENEERAAARALNSLRGLQADEVTESLEWIGSEALMALTPPKRAQLKDDVRAAHEAFRAAQAGADLASEKNRPSLDLFASVSLNGQDLRSVPSSISESIGKSFAFTRPSETIGLKFSIPLTEARSKALEGWQLEKVAAEKNYDKKLFDQERSWRDLNESFADQKKQWELACSLEELQKTRLETEKARFKSGRSTTYQVLLSEQDYVLTELAQIRLQTAILSTLAQMKLFGESL
ncbi:MAG: TolC family protein [Bdellovibrionia bacterium]